jgi:hypothetical protein
VLEAFRDFHRKVKIDPSLNQPDLDEGFAIKPEQETHEMPKSRTGKTADATGLYFGRQAYPSVPTERLNTVRK